MDTFQPFPSCSAYCHKGFHTTHCETARGVLKISNKVAKNAMHRLRPFFFEAIGRGAESDEEVLLTAVDLFYEAAVFAQWISAASPTVKEEISKIREQVAIARRKTERVFHASDDSG